MAPKIQFGWRVPDFPEGGAPSMTFRNQIFQYMDVIHGRLDSAWVGDHFFPWLEGVDQSQDTIEAWTTLAFLLSRYPNLDMGTIVLSNSYRPPAYLAKSAAVLQWLSGGRFILGIGAGWKENEYRAYGYDYPPAAERIHQLEEAVQIILAMWTEDCPSFEGKYYTIKDACCSPRPSPLPPILIGGGGRKLTLRLVARFADWWNHPNSSPEQYADLLSVLRGHCEDVDRDYDEIVKTWANDCLVVAGSRDEAERIQRESRFRDYGPIVGTPDDVAARIQQYVDLGVTHFIFRFADFPSTSGVEMFIQEVMPRFES
jgi:alkanesulfonate monooxygenase SsuD/methylene tetrahydromethanopterin reductase-like flavin-dependent oxidoreductase (luciferase family)